jgi:4-methyl-5(b-hydroxyethyl)-thiazole monophosphate biosynthesis
MRSMPDPTVLVILAEGFEEIEAVAPVDLLRRAGAVVKVAALGDGIHVTGRNRLMVHADATLSSVGDLRFDCLILPGGPGVSLLRKDPLVLGQIRRQIENKGWIAAICAAPVVLKDAGALEGRRYTAHFSVASELPEALLGERVVCDAWLITSRGAGTAIEFGLMVVEKLFSREKAGEVAKSIFA